MRLAVYWVLFIALVLYALTLDAVSPLFYVFLFVLVVFFLFLVFATIRSIVVAGWNNFWFTLRYGAREQAIRKRDATTESPLELSLAAALDKQGIAYEREYRVSKMHVDFAFPASKLAVECDGYRYHHSSEQRERDARRDDMLRRYGWKVLRFDGTDIRQDVGSCVRKIREYL